MNNDPSNFESMVERFRELRFREWVGLSAKRRGRRKLIGPAPFSLGLLRPILLPAEKNWFRLTNEIRTERVPLDSMIRGHFLGARPPRPPAPSFWHLGQVSSPARPRWPRLSSSVRPSVRPIRRGLVVVDCAPPLSFLLFRAATKSVRGVRKEASLSQSRNGEHILGRGGQE